VARDNKETQGGESVISCTQRRYFWDLGSNGDQDEEEAELTREKVNSFWEDLAHKQQICLSRRTTILHGGKRKKKFKGENS